MRDWRDEEQDRRIDEMYHRETGGDGGNDIIEFIVWIVIGFIVILAVAGFLDNTFGWGLVDWIWGALYDWTNGTFGTPNN